MRAVASAVASPVAAELQDEFNGPVAYADRWLWLALLGLVLVAAYYLAVLWFTRDRSATGPMPWSRPDVPSVRQQHLDRIDRIEEAVGDGQVSARAGHQELSETVRSYVGEVSSLPAPTMTLADLRLERARPLADAIELMYPPEFAPDDVGEAQERFDQAVAQARGLVASWN